MQYYWNSGLGTNFILNYFSHLTSPLNLLVIFVKREQISAFISFLIVLKISLSAGTFSFFLSRKNTLLYKSNVMIVALSVAYSLCNFATCYSHEIMWLDAFILLPIIILGFERLIRDKKPYIYILSLSFCAFCNAYPTYFIAEIGGNFDGSIEKAKKLYKKRQIGKSNIHGNRLNNHNKGCRNDSILFL